MVAIKVVGEWSLDAFFGVNLYGVAHDGVRSPHSQPPSCRRKKPRTAGSSVSGPAHPAQRAPRSSTSLSRGTACRGSSSPLSSGSLASGDPPGVRCRPFACVRRRLHVAGLSSCAGNVSVGSRRAQVLTVVVLSASVVVFLRFIGIRRRAVDNRPRRSSRISDCVGPLPPPGNEGDTIVGVLYRGSYWLVNKWLVRRQGGLTTLRAMLTTKMVRGLSSVRPPVNLSLATMVTL